MRGYRPFIYGVIVAGTAIFGGFALYFAAGGDAGSAVFLLALLGLWLFFGLRAQRRTPYRVTVTAAGVRAESLFGTREITWDQVRRIQLLWSRWKAGRVEQVEIASIGNDKVVLVNRLSEFDHLVTQLRRIRPQLIQE